MTKATEIEEQAATWLIQIDAEGSPVKWTALEAWLNGDLRHRAAFLRLSAGWSRADVLKKLCPGDGSVNEDLLIPAQRLPHGSRSGEQRRAFRVPVRRIAALAAALALAIGAVWIGVDRLLAPQYHSGFGAHEHIALRDGSSVELNTDSRIRVRLDARRRDIELVQGEALFRVARDAQRTFAVEAGGATIRALGTMFSVRLRPSGTVEVLVGAGRIALTAQQTAALQHATPLRAGDVVSVHDGEFTLKEMNAVQVGRKLAWIDGRIWFQGETLRDAAEEFNRYNRRHLRIADPSIEDLRIGGNFRATDPASFITALNRSFGIRVIESSAAEIRIVGGAYH